MNKDQIIEAIKAMTVLELNELVKACEEEFGVSAAAPVAAAGAAGQQLLKLKNRLSSQLFLPAQAQKRSRLSRLSEN